jgi:hypothetical protein
LSSTIPIAAPFAAFYAIDAPVSDKSVMDNSRMFDGH